MKLAASVPLLKRGDSIAEISKFFPDIAKFALECRFDDCKHLNEPSCAVLKALEEQKIAASRYNSYKSILLDLDEKKYR
jgi:ribosome biogenesis GTPase